MNERGGLQRLAGRGLRHLARRQLAQFVVNKRQEIVDGLDMTVGRTLRVGANDSNLPSLNAEWNSKDNFDAMPNRSLNAA